MHGLLRVPIYIPYKEVKSSIQASLTKDDALDILLECSVTNIYVVFWLLYILIVAFVSRSRHNLQCTSADDKASEVEC